MPVRSNNRTWWSGLDDRWQLTLARNLYLTNKLGAAAFEQLVRADDPRMGDLERLYAQLPGKPGSTSDADLDAILELETLVCGGVNIADIRPLRRMSRVRTLSLSPSLELRSGTTLAHLEHLEWLSLYHTKITKLEPLAELRKLRWLRCAASRVRTLEALRNLHELEHVVVSFGTAISDLDPLRGLSKLEQLDLNRGKIEQLEPLRSLGRLRTLDISFNRELRSVEPLGCLPRLEELVMGSTAVTSVAPLAGVSTLRSLDAIFAPVADFAALASVGIERLAASPGTLDEVLALRSLTHVRLRSKTVSDLAGIETLPRLRQLTLSTNVKSLAPLGSLATLEALEVDDRWVRDLSPLATLSQLRELDVENTGVKDLAPLAGLRNLTKLSLSHTKVRSLAALRPLEGLRWLFLRDTPIEDLEVLSDLPNLELVIAPDDGAAAALRKHLPSCVVES